MEIDRKTIKALSADTRVKILKSLVERRKMPSELAREFKLATSTITEHLRSLEKVDLIIKKETGHKWKYYELTTKGKSLVVKPKIPISFVILLSIGVIFMFSGYANLYFMDYQEFSYPITTITREITSNGEMLVATTGVDKVGEVKEPDVVENIDTDYETTDIPVEKISTVSLILLIVGSVIFVVVIVQIILRKFYYGRS